MKKLSLNDVQFEVLYEIVKDLIDDLKGDLEDEVLYTPEAYQIYQQFISLKEAN